MNYDNIIELLLQEFPDIKEQLEEEEYISGLPHCIMEIIFLPYVKKLCADRRKDQLTRVVTFIEIMAICSDQKVNELLSVSFLEPIVLADSEMLPSLEGYLGKKSLEELNYWRQRYGQT